ncbi:GNAT family N-acetyltransferase [Mycetocola zhujimingii]|uniref:GNAT family N-acetyltransferase n=1 Tax=Mycetocola zhujimingii TaxID=2079792 RepID=A0A2U1TB60_9MICO|nr:GNAT family N-acetyltransferase [Mycetocola zhujimingii]PWC06132.1 GNAT family N-acetyltransferase [Mycetocola zhujimingii]
MQHDEPVLAIERREYSHPDVRRLIGQLQDLYVSIYGGSDESPIDDADFQPPRGVFAVGYIDDEPVAMGAWRSVESAGGSGRGRGELKRMFVDERYRGRSYSGAILSWLENSAREHGVTFMILETNLNHPTAIALYRSAGYRDIPNYGHYANNPRTVSLGRGLLPAS